MSTTTTHRSLTEAIKDVLRPQSVEELNEASTLIQKNTQKLENMLSVLRDDLNPSRSSYVKARVQDHPEAKAIFVQAFKKIQEVEGLMDDLMALEIKSADKSDAA